MEASLRSQVHIRGLATSTETISKIFAILHFFHLNPVPGIRQVRSLTQAWHLGIGILWMIQALCTLKGENEVAIARPNGYYILFLLFQVTQFPPRKVKYLVVDLKSTSDPA